MTFVLSSQNVFEYLIQHHLCTASEQSQSKVELKYAKNFNLLLSLSEEHKLLVKQEPRNQKGETAGEFLREWRIQECLRKFPELHQIENWISEAIHFDSENSIIVFNYLDNYRDLADFYSKENIFPRKISVAIGLILAKIHRLTFNHSGYQEFFNLDQESTSSKLPLHLSGQVERISPEIFGMVPADGLKFFALYQKYDSLGQAIAELLTAYTPCCFSHNDLKLNNILLPLDWEKTLSENDVSNNRGIRFIDWERSTWGDPAFDLGMLVGSYLLIWLGSLITSRDIEIEDSLRMATTPLEQLQPSLAALVGSYLHLFPEILDYRSDFLRRVIQFSGLSLIQAIQSTLQYQKSFGNTGICMLQVAKSLLCRPEASMRTVFGMEASALTSFSNRLA